MISAGILAVALCGLTVAGRGQMAYRAVFDFLTRHGM